MVTRVREPWLPTISPARTPSVYLRPSTYRCAGTAIDSPRPADRGLRATPRPSSQKDSAAGPANLRVVRCAEPSTAAASSSSSAKAPVPALGAHACVPRIALGFPGGAPAGPVCVCLRGSLGRFFSLSETPSAKRLCQAAQPCSSHFVPHRLETCTYPRDQQRRCHFGLDALPFRLLRARQRCSIYRLTAALPGAVCASARPLSSQRPSHATSTCDKADPPRRGCPPPPT